MRNRFVILAVALALLVTLRDDARAQGPAIAVENPRSFTVGGTVWFSVKFLCGTINVGTGLPLAAGTYLTAISIQNLTLSPVFIAISVNEVLKFDVALTARSVQRLDCRNIVPGSFFPSGFAPANPFSEGFVLMGLSGNKGPQVNVVAVYTVSTAVVQVP